MGRSISNTRKLTKSQKREAREARKERRERINTKVVEGNLFVLIIAVVVAIDIKN